MPYSYIRQTPTIFSCSQLTGNERVLLFVTIEIGKLLNYLFDRQLARHPRHHQAWLLAPLSWFIHVSVKPFTSALLSTGAFPKSRAPLVSTCRSAL